MQKEMDWIMNFFKESSSMNETEKFIHRIVIGALTVSLEIGFIAGCAFRQKDGAGNQAGIQSTMAGTMETSSVDTTLSSFSASSVSSLSDSDKDFALKETDDARIHFITLPISSNSILLECNGHFGMVDSGEDSDYPDGSDARYPERSGISKADGYEDTVIEYMKSAGVTEDNFDFYIGTHAHSDHIGSADEIIRVFKPDRVYLQKYDDCMITDDTRLWDNQYVYDNAIQAALDTGSTIIQCFDENAPLYPEVVQWSGTFTCVPSGSGLTESEHGKELSADSADTADPASDGQPKEISVILVNDENGKKYETDAHYVGDFTWKYTIGNVQKYNDEKQTYSYSLYADNDDHLDGYDVEFSTPDVTDEKTTTPRKTLTDHMVRPDYNEEYDDSLEANRVSRFANLWDEMNTVSTPEFTLGGDMGIRILHYNNNYLNNPRWDANDFSLAVCVTVNSHTILLAGDVNNDEYAEEKLLEELGHVDVLNSGHHGMYGSGSYNYVVGLKPELLIFCGPLDRVSNRCVKGNTMGLYDAFNTLCASGAHVYATSWYTDELGAIVVSPSVSGITTNIPEGETHTVRILEDLFSHDSETDDFFSIDFTDGIPDRKFGWIYENGGYFYYNEESEAVRGWIALDRNVYFYISDSGCVYGWQFIDGNWFYFDEHAQLSIDSWVYTNGYWYRVDTDGRMMRDQWYTDSDGNLYYLDTDGRMVTGRRKIGDKVYSFDENGVCGDE